jgi:RimJ/RimL family protein N-acetyltransferase
MHGLPTSTRSLQLRHFVQDDALDAMVLNAEPSTRLWLPSHVYVTVEAAHSRLQYLIACYHEPGHPQLGPYVLAVVETSTARLLGHVGFSPLENDVEVSYAIAESARGRGYGVEALVCACDWVASTFSVPRVVAITALANHSSRRILERASFAHVHDEDMRFQGVWQAVSRYCWHASTQRSGA